MCPAIESHITHVQSSIWPNIQGDPVDTYSPFPAHFPCHESFGPQVPVASTSLNSDLGLSPHFQEAAMLSVQTPSLCYRPESQRMHRAP